MNEQAYNAQITVARAGMNPDAAIEAFPLAEFAQVEVEAPAGVPSEPHAVVKRRLHGLTLDVEVDPPPPYRRWRFFVFYVLIRLAAWVYPFNFEMYRTRQPWE